jgi:hypothetical protein
MFATALQPDSAWAEDRALLRSNPSAVPGAEVGVGAENPSAPLPFLLRSWHPSAKPSRHDAATASAGCPSPLANANRPKFHFPLNQDKLIWYPKIDRLQLFDLKTDPHELHDPSDEANQSERIAAMRTKLMAWLQDHGDELVLAPGSEKSEN